ncbi:phosphatidylinositol-specific phospholipase C/glycerophosphodiester phosphodiesterase family protein [Actinocatenispora rupis]|uniref:Glycerophosphoryl diester phosphodiesterase n=1 Tax=Actinocatenispora rupis TaxID=519421 RepID=A0A8J3JI52_9ACTN|nr:phosphatidylinositol-specific phospholipase C/glycerophosphodiester phosphodiesterase family protein [Actinocatenispora rupis]GID16333.1 hypothetical protein Aru02nite_72220 [Actinocatenispora rupis]
MSGLGTAVAGLGGLAVVGAGAATVGALAGRTHPYLANGHAHNDYKHRRPLASALRLGYASVEADVLCDGAELLVGHGPREVAPDRTLRGLYLDPLAARVRAHGSVHPGVAEPFQLLVELKAEPERCCRVLAAQLRAYAGMLSRCTDAGVRAGPVTVVVTGAGTPHETVAAQRDRVLFCDGSLSDVDTKGLSPSVVPLVSERWSRRFRWRGRGPLPADERRALRALVDQVHADGRRVRFWDLPDRVALWRELSAAGVDHIGTDRLRTFAAYQRRSWLG